MPCIHRKSERGRKSETAKRSEGGRNTCVFLGSVNDAVRGTRGTGISLLQLRNGRWRQESSARAVFNGREREKGDRMMCVGPRRLGSPRVDERRTRGCYSASMYLKTGNSEP